MVSGGGHVTLTWAELTRWKFLLLQYSPQGHLEPLEGRGERRREENGGGKAME